VDANGNYPMTGSTWGPTASLWTYQAATPASFMSTYVSGSQRLANGNTLVCAGWIGRTREVDRNSNTVWEYVNPAAASGVATQGDPTAPAQRGLFRAPHYAPDYAAFKGRNLVAGAPLEAHPAVLLADGSTLPHIKRVGTSVELSLRASHLPGQIYLVGTSATDGLIPVDRRFARMGADIVLQASLFGHAPATFRRYFGLLDGSGQATAAIAVPAIPDLKGLLLYTTMFVHHPLAPNSIGMISNTVVVEIDT
jgi:hypothetical protein